jgi:hypothetical protein
MSWRGRFCLSEAGDGTLRCLEDALEEIIEVGKGVEVQGGVCLLEPSSSAVRVCEILSSNSGGLMARREGKVERRIELGEGVI